MFSLPNIEMPSIPPLLFTFLAVLLGTLLKELLAITMKHLPQQLHDKIFSTLESIIGNYFSQMTLIFAEKLPGGSMNEMFEASENYMRKQISPLVKRLKVSKALREKDLCVTIDEGVEIVDTFRGIQFTWIFIVDKQKSIKDYAGRFFKLRFHKKHWEMVKRTYLPHVLRESEAMKEENKVLNLNSFDKESTNLDHPSTFKTLAMDPKLKKELMDDLDRFVKRGNFYRSVGKAWKRGYLLYGPPGTGKSSLIAAIANYLKFHIYEVELKRFRHNPDLKRLLLSAPSKSILVIEDIDHDIHNFQDKESQLTLSMILNFIDGLWSNCADQRIIIFTANNKDKLDPAIVRPGRMDKHIHMSYCTFDGFKTLASNYLGIGNDPKFTEIRELLEELKVTPAEIAEELMKSDTADESLGGLIEFLHMKKSEHDKANAEGEKEVGEQAKEIPRNKEGAKKESEET